MENPLISICIPTYNAARTIRETIASILAQTYPNLLVHVSDNASTDNTLEIIRSFNDPRIIIHEHIKNVGGEENFNRCIQYAEGDFTAIFHSDDIYDSKIAASQVKCFQKHPQLGVVHTEAYTIDENGSINGLIGRSNIGTGEVDIYDFPLLFKAVLERGNFIVCPSAMFRTAILKEEIQRWRGDLFRSSADLDVWLRITQKHCLAVIKNPLMQYRVDLNQFSNQVRRRTSQADIFLVIEHYLVNPGIINTLNSDDKRNYRLLLANDKLWQAINFYTIGDVESAKKSLTNLISSEFIISSTSSRRNLLMVLTTLALQASILSGCHTTGAKILKFFIKIYKK